MDDFIEDDNGGDKEASCLITPDGEQICYTVFNDKKEGRSIAGVGRLFIIVAALILRETFL